MKILLLVPQPFFQIRGTPIAIYQILRSLSGRGHKIDMITYHVGQDMHVPDVTIHRTMRIPFIKNVKIGPSLVKILLDMIMFIKAFWMLATRKYDVVHAVEESVFIAVFLKIFFKKPVIYDMDSVISDQLYYTRFATHGVLLWFVKKIEMWAIHNSIAIITVCKALSDSVRKINADKKIFQVEDIPVDDFSGEVSPEMDAAFHSQLGIGERKVFLYTGNFESYQGVELFVRAAEFLKQTHSDFCFVLVGGEPDHIEKMRSLAQEIGCSDYIVFTGKRPINEMPVFERMADVLVSPRREGTNTPLKIYSYMKAQKPIVATNILTHTQVLDDDCACLVEPDSKALAEGMKRVLDDADYATRIAAAARKHTDEKYNYETLERKINNVYRYVAEQSGNTVS